MQLAAWGNVSAVSPRIAPIWPRSTGYPDLGGCLLASPSSNQIWRMTVTPFTAATHGDTQRQHRLQPKPARQLLALCGSKWAHCGIDTTQRSADSTSASAAEWHSYGMQQKMRPYPQPGCMQHKGLRRLCNLQLGQQHHHHYITAPRQISALRCCALLWLSVCVCVLQCARASVTFALRNWSKCAREGCHWQVAPQPGQARPRPAPSVPPPCACAKQLHTPHLTLSPFALIMRALAL